MGHLLREARQFARAGDQRRAAHERAAAMLAAQQAMFFEIAQRVAKVMRLTPNNAHSRSSAGICLPVAHSPPLMMVRMACST